MFRRKVIGYTTMSVRVDDLTKLRQLKAIGVITSISGWLHFLITKEIQELKKRNIVKKRENLEDRTMKLTDDERLEKYINNYNDYMESLGYSPISDDNFEIIAWEK
ncbi:MAG: hypothetical protein IJS47_04905 [Clostridia bacterium]|nr:hypothetical protein [Clostridia bacterium]